MSDSDDDEKAIPSEPLTPLRWTLTWRIKIGLFVVHLATAIAQFVLSAVTDAFDFQANVVKFGRYDPAVDSSGTPGLQFIEIGPVYVNLIFAAANLFGAVGYVFSLFFNQKEMHAIEYGLLPFVWIFVLLATMPLWFALALTSGMAAWTELLLFSGLVFGIVFIYWLGTYLGIYVRPETNNTLTMWTVWLIAVLMHLIGAIVLIQNIAVKTASGGPGIHLMPIIIGLVCSLFTPILVGVSSTGLFKQHTNMMLLYICTSLSVVAVSWFGLIAFASDGIDYP